MQKSKQYVGDSKGRYVPPCGGRLVVNCPIHSPLGREYVAILTAHSFLSPGKVAIWRPFRHCPPRRLPPEDLGSGWGIQNGPDLRLPPCAYY